MAHIIYIQESNLNGTPRRKGEVVRFDDNVINSLAATPLQIGLAVAIPAFAASYVSMPQSAFEYLLVRAGVLPEPTVDEPNPLQAAIRRA